MLVRALATKRQGVIDRRQRAESTEERREEASKRRRQPEESLVSEIDAGEARDGPLVSVGSCVQSVLECTAGQPWRKNGVQTAVHFLNLDTCVCIELSPKPAISD